MNRSLAASLILLAFLGTPGQADNNADVWGDDYATGTKLNNLGRLGESFDNFEKNVQKKRTSKEAEAYLLKIRSEISTNAKKQSEERTNLNYSSNSPESALNVSYPEKGQVKITLHAKFLFDENTASLKNASMDIIDRLATLIEAKAGNRIELTLVNEMDDTPDAPDIDAERALVIFALLEFKGIEPLS